jgi:hypothetical protein
MTATETPTRTNRIKTSLPAEFRDGHSENDGLSTFLGLFSIGLGLAEALAPRRFAETIGVRYSDALVRAYGARELAAGVGILAGRHPTGWLWSRVAGDVMDLATLVPELADADEDRRRRVGNAIAAVAGALLMDVVAAGRQSMR